MKNTNEIERYRIKTGKFASSVKDGNNGLFLIPYGSDILQCIISDGMGWEHVSVTVRFKNRTETETPTWRTMCVVKDIFWNKDEVVIQYHPRESDYINNHENVLHLWKPLNKELPIPDLILVGIK